MLDWMREKAKSGPIVNLQDVSDASLGGGYYGKT